jgi:hypothetical protein
MMYDWHKCYLKYEMRTSFKTADRLDNIGAKCKSVLKLNILTSMKTVSANVFDFQILYQNDWCKYMVHHLIKKLASSWVNYSMVEGYWVVDTVSAGQESVFI